MWAVEIRFLTVGQERHPRSVAFVDVTAKGDQERFKSAQTKFLGVGVVKRAASVFFSLFMAYRDIEWWRYQESLTG